MMNLKAQHARLMPEIRAAIEPVFESSDFIHGEAVGRFEEELSHYLERDHVVSCANGSDALYLAIKALNLPQGSEVVVAAFTFVAAAEAIVENGLIPVFADADEDTYNVTAEEFEKRITPKTKAIIVTHLFGCPSDMRAILHLAYKHRLYIIEDVAQAIGGSTLIDSADLQNMLGGDLRVKLGTIGDIGCTSFFPSKNLGCMGDGGAVITKSTELAERVRMLANHGSRGKYNYEEPGRNSRLDTLQAAVLSVKLKHLDEFNNHRRGVAMMYNEFLANCPGIVLPKDVDGHIYHQYVIKVKNGKRQELQDFLKANGIATLIHYPVSLNSFTCFTPATPQFLDTAQSLTKEVLSLPIDSELTREQVEFVATAIKNFFKTQDNA